MGGIIILKYTLIIAYDSADLIRSAKKKKKTGAHK
jgi:hypothetical protein